MWLFNFIWVLGDNEGWWDGNSGGVCCVGRCTIEGANILHSLTATTCCCCWFIVGVVDSDSFCMLTDSFLVVTQGVNVVQFSPTLPSPFVAAATAATAAAAAAAAASFGVAYRAALWNFGL